MIDTALTECAHREQHVINFIERKPVLYQPSISKKNGRAITYVKLYYPLISPPSIFFHKVKRHFAVRKRYHRLNIMFAKRAEQTFIVVKTSFIWLGIVTMWKDATPIDRKSISLEPHFRK
ncbi:hypothetical protein COLSTE_01881 [Collinsella stercoris DSM 13279]|uniref:Uncharacterized protein n=1 Tax=Collinsella stercoris DSM 13279 TaxID=445975 RepID=B6GCQ7_9ACTN|nr:hypothetical protein COLSTE_01881 [Collinsella stercoris DSM 13279]